jgi:hypothetical protein
MEDNSILKQLFPQTRVDYRLVGPGDYDLIESGANLLASNPKNPQALCGTLRKENTSFLVNLPTAKSNSAQISSSPLRWCILRDENSELFEFYYPQDPFHPVPKSTGGLKDPLHNARVSEDEIYNCNLIFVQGHGTSNHESMVPGFEKLYNLPRPSIIWLNSCNESEEYNTHLKNCFEKELSSQIAIKLTSANHLCVASAFRVPPWIFPLFNQCLINQMRRNAGLNFAQNCFPAVIRDVHRRIFPINRAEYMRCYYEIQAQKHESNVFLHDFFAHLAYRFYGNIKIPTPLLDSTISEEFESDLFRLKELETRNAGVLLFPRTGALKAIYQSIFSEHLQLFTFTHKKSLVVVILPAFNGTSHLNVEELNVSHELGDCLVGISRRAGENLKVHALSKIDACFTHDQRSFRIWAQAWERRIQKACKNASIEFHKVLLDSTRLRNLDGVVIPGFNEASFQTWKGTVQNQIQWSENQLQGVIDDSTFLQWYLYFQHNVALTSIDLSQENLSSLEKCLNLSSIE